MKVLLIDPPWDDLYGKYKPAAKVGVLYPPLGLCYLSAYLKQSGHEVKLIDAEAEEYNIDLILDDINGYCPDIIGIRSISPLWRNIQNLTKEIKAKHKIPIVLGGPHITIVKDESFQSTCCDYAIYGEGEQPTVELIDAIGQNKDRGSIDNLIFRKNGKIIRNHRRPRVEKLDGYLFPDRSILNIKKYKWSVPKKGIVDFATILSSRGCPFQCTFCSQDSMFGRTTRFRSPENLVDEIESVCKEYNIDHFIFIDDTLTLDRKRILEVCRKIKEKALEITWEGWTHVNTIDEELLRNMKMAGLVRLSFGIESGNEKILKSIKKGATLAKIEEAYKITKKVGIETRGSVILGLPYDTKATVKETIRFVRGLKGLDQAYFNIAMPYPGTEIREMALKGEGGVRLLTEDYSELRRHGNVVMEVNDLTKEELLKLQRQAWLSFFFTPRRIFYNFFRAGIKAGLINGWAFFRSFILPKH